MEFQKDSRRGEGKREQGQKDRRRSKEKKKAALWTRGSVGNGGQVSQVRKVAELSGPQTGRFLPGALTHCGQVWWLHTVSACLAKAFPNLHGSLREKSRHSATCQLPLSRPAVLQGRSLSYRAFEKSDGLL
jgi:hypothetical protein